MKYIIQRMEARVWWNFSEHAHKACFSEVKPADWDRIDYALLAVNEDDVPIGYMTCREFDSKSVYWQYGGAFKPIEKTIHAYRVYEAFLEWHSKRYERVATYISNGNKTMLAMAAKIGFKVTGIRNYKGEVLLEHLLEFNEK